MHKEKFNISLISECSIFIKFDESISENAVGELARSIRETFASITMNVVPSYQTILIDYLPFRINEKNLVNELQQIVSQFDTQSLKLSQPNHITIPVYYSEETALDLSRFQKRGLSLDDLITLHTKTEYAVSAIGFAPGFAFLSDVDTQLHMARLATPRTHVPAGSVGIADSKTAVYPSDSPGGWNIIGKSPLALFSDSPPFIPFEVGDKVTFNAISKQEFIDLGGVL
ncbi:5-oxoprolinase subunit B family protein [Vibrio alginolyticus]|uniref:5-oxoprolinase subunit B family protein n=1 Tax=Vibrio alginolyticus TaxID=663 RepID=UPI001BD53E9E|nr:carboxyltransferase domain-containing protein [Vibrio alginolyticus]EGQ8038645.1 carboxyltransferase domain-containing protein [Vibrio alginolyticus]ELA7353743.1 carboxyltransferase domain-containing protein [Vibrio alginolyticus]MBS9904337.1 carboxyltransferase domain-containing protein [Vibrio alginolyticus]MBS9931758.1 carboxyltransferase domain-containing protein [Vibrio alginolyticus]MBS9982022.1 carboxyltransferase domain-containing protein [Vibrio alginolyticus]